MYIELYGFPGAGKSTLCRGLNKTISNVVYAKRVHKATQLNPVLFLKTVPYWLRIIKLLYKTKALSKGLFNALVICYYHFLEAKHSKKIYIIDHGFVQTLVQAPKLRKHLLNNKNSLKYAINLVPKDALVIYLKLDIKTAKKRARIRAKKESSFNYEEYKQLFSRVNKIMKNMSIESSHPAEKTVQYAIQKIKLS